MSTSQAARRKKKTARRYVPLLSLEVFQKLSGTLRFCLSDNSDMATSEGTWTTGLLNREHCLGIREEGRRGQRILGGNWQLLSHILGQLDFGVFVLIFVGTLYLQSKGSLSATGVPNFFFYYFLLTLKSFVM